MKGKNKIIINPTQSEEMKPGEDTSAEKTKESSADKRIRMVKRKILQSKMQAVRQGAGADIVAHTELEGEQISEGECGKCGGDHETKDHNKEEDPRGMKTKVNMVRNKLRAMGLKMSHVPEGEMTEAAEDSLRDRRMERGGVDGNTRYDRAPKAPNTKKFGTGKTMAQKEMEKKYGKGASAMDIVRAEIRAKHGKGAIK